MNRLNKTTLTSCRRNRWLHWHHVSVVNDYVDTCQCSRQKFFANICTHRFCLFIRGPGGVFNKKIVSKISWNCLFNVGEKRISGKEVIWIKEKLIKEVTLQYTWHQGVVSTLLSQNYCVIFIFNELFSKLFCYMHLCKKIF